MKLSKIKKSYMTLLELLIALGLTSFLLMILMMFYRETSLFGTLTAKAEMQSFQIRYIENRLASLFSNLVPKQNHKQEFYFFTTSSFQTQGPALLFSYDNRVRADHRFAGKVIGLLALDMQGNLVLYTTPPPVEWKMLEVAQIPLHREVLMENVQSLLWTFIDFPNAGKEDKIVDPKQVETGKEKKNIPNIPVHDWQEEFQHVPAIVKILVKSQGKETEFSFVIPRKGYPIIYTK